MKENARSPGFPQISMLTQAAWDEVDEGIEQAIAKGRREPTCSAGCHFCCYEKVSASPNEVFEIVAHVRSTWSAAAQSDLLSRLRRAVAHATDDPKDYFDAHVPCPLLNADGQCSVYEVRPINCRRCHSYSPVEACQSYAPQVVLNQLIMSAVSRDRERMARQLNALSLHSDSVVFLAALLQALEDITLLERWLDGESVFDAWVWPVSDASHR